MPYTDLCVMLLPVPLYSGQLEVDRQLSCCLMCTVAPWRHAVTDPWPRLMHPKDLVKGHLHLQGEQQLQGMCVLMTRREQQSQV